MVTLIRHDLEFILAQIVIAERHAAGENLTDIIPNDFLPWGLRTVDGSLNNLLPGQEFFGAADTIFPSMVDQNFRLGTDNPFVPGIQISNYSTAGSKFDSQPRLISNLIVDQTADNPAAVDASDGTFDFLGNMNIPNVATDEGLSAPFNSWMTLFGQFFDHGLDLVTKGGNGTVYIPLAVDDPLYDPAPGAFNFMLMTRATNIATHAGADLVMGTADDVHMHMNTTTSWVDQNQTYTSHASHQVFLREYAFSVDTDDDNINDAFAVATGRMLEGANGGLASWAEIKAQALTMLGIQLSDFDIGDVPLLVTDLYGKFVPDPLTGFAQFVTADGSPLTADPDSPIPPFIPATLLDPAEGVLRTGHAFLNDIAHHAAPGTYDHDSSIGTPNVNQDVDSDLDVDGDGIYEPGMGDLLTDVNGDTFINGADFFADDGDNGTYDDEMLGRHFITGDGRGNENIGLTTAHFVFHAEHNRLVDHTKDVIIADAQALLAGGATVGTAIAFLNEWLIDDVAAVPSTPAELDALIWDGERLFQAARFSTEMQYQHLVFEEFARKIQPMLDIFGAYDATIDPSIVGEFAHVVYRFGHSMLTNTIDRYDASFNADHIGLIEAFLNPVEFTAGGTVTQEEMASQVIRGMTRQVGNAIDEFVVEALRNNLVGLPLDLATINLARGRDTGVPTLNAVRRDFFANTSDASLTPYTSWVDFAAHTKYELSVVNFIAAYGTHAAFAALPPNHTAQDRRDVALELVLDDGGDPNNVIINSVLYTDRLDFLNSTGAHASLPSGVTTTGVDAIDLWIGGLAEATSPFGGMLGTTFNFVFETQMEALQDGDRFYYLARTAGLNFLHQLEANSFASLIMRNTNVTHLPADVFSTPTYTLEVTLANQFNLGLGVNGDEDPTAGGIFQSLVIRDNPATPGIDSNYLHFTGEDHVVLGGSAADDILIAGLGDDTVYGDGGSDRLEGNAGNDFLIGGDGDDFLTDTFGDDNLKGGDGNDVISAGPGFDLILAGNGIDFVIAGEHAKETFGGGGDDFILHGSGGDTVFAGEGDDWVEGGGGSDLLQGDNGDPFQNSSVIGNDVIYGGGGDDDADTESGDDIVIAGEGIDRAEGMLGFDWATYRDETAGIEADMLVRVFGPPPLPGSPNAFLDRFDSIEGLSGTGFSDILRGDSLNLAGGLLTGHELRNFDLISGLKDGPNALFNPVITEFTGGNIILGGAGSDIIEGRGGNDLIDGDAWLNVRLSIRNELNPNIELFSVNSMTEIQADVLAGIIKPGQIRIVREILMSPTEDFDTAVYTGAMGEYLIEGAGNDVDGDGYITVTHNSVILGAGQGIDGIDKVRNIERLQFSDATFNLGGTNASPVGALTVNDSTPEENQLITVSAAGVTDADNIPVFNLTGAITGPGTPPVAYFWQVELVPDSDIFEDLFIDILGEVSPVTGVTFQPGDAEVGLRLRVRALYQDGHGVLEQVFSAPTTAVANVNDDPQGALLISDPTPTETQVLSAINSFTDADGLNTAVYTYEWFQATVTGVGGGGAFTLPDGGANWDPIAGALDATFTPGAAQVDRKLIAVVTYTDDNGTVERVVSAETIVTGDFFAANNLAQTLNGNEGQDIIFGGGGADTINGNGQNDTIDGGTGNDTINAGAGNDIINYVIGGNTDTVNGGADADTLNIVGTASANESVIVIYNGTAITTVAGGAVSLVETFNIDLAGGAGDTLSYVGTTAAVTVNLTTNVASGFASIAGVENVIGGTGADTLTGRVGINNTLTGGSGNDTFFVHETTDVVSEAAAGGTDLVNSLSNIYTITDTDVENLTFTGVGSFTGTGNTSANVITGGAGNDILAGGGNNVIDTLNGLAGNDTFNYTMGQGADVVNGGLDSDTLNVTGGGGGDILDVSFNGTSITLLEGGAINSVESITAALAGGTDTLVYIAAGAVSVDLGAGTASGFTSISSIENATGGAGSDTLIGTAGVTNVLTGGLGNDTYTVHDTLDTAVDTGVGVDLVNSFANVFSIANNNSLDNLTFVGVGNFTGTGNTAANTITGGIGNDTLNGGTGNDTLNGLDGDDVINYNMGGGADAVNGGLNNDTLNVIGGAGADTLDVSFDGASITLLEGGVISGVESVTAALAGGTDALVYTAAGAVTVDLGAGTASGFTSISGIENVTGGSGADLLIGASGVTNAFTGGNGNDTFVVQDAADTVSEAGGVGGGIDLVQANINTFTITDADVENLTFVGVGNFTGTGNGSANTIIGGAGLDNLSGLGGVDRLEGGAGNDLLNGGTGLDVYFFAAAFGNDTINEGAGVFDFTGPTQDTIRLDASTGITDLASFNANVTIGVGPTAADTLITLLSGDSITILGVASANITFTDFTFGP